MKRTLLILALCGSAYAGDYYCDLERQLERIECQQEEILRRQQQAEQARRDVERKANEQRQLDEIHRDRIRNIEFYERIYDVDLSYMK